MSMALQAIDNDFKGILRGALANHQQPVHAELLELWSREDGALELGGTGELAGPVSQRAGVDDVGRLVGQRAGVVHRVREQRRIPHFGQNTVHLAGLARSEEDLDPGRHLLVRLLVGQEAKAAEGHAQRPLGDGLLDLRRGQPVDPERGGCQPLGCQPARGRSRRGANLVGVQLLRVAQADEHDAWTGAGVGRVAKMSDLLAQGLDGQQLRDRVIAELVHARHQLQRRLGLGHQRYQQNVARQGALVAALETEDGAVCSHVAPRGQRRTPIAHEAAYHRPSRVESRPRGDGARLRGRGLRP